MEAERFEAGGQQVLLEYPQDVQAFPARAVEVIQRAASAGLKLQDGTRIQMGWSVLTIKAQEGALRVYEPDFDRDPFEDLKPGVQTTLRVPAGQVLVLGMIEETGVDARFDQSVVVHQDALDQEHIFLRRDVSSAPQDSGWLIADVSQAGEVLEDGLEAVSICGVVSPKTSVAEMLERTAERYHHHERRRDRQRFRFRRARPVAIARCKNALAA
jgi:hypothetical protein